jgi:segregation and condensation protein B
MEITNLIPHIESLIFASDKPLTGLELTELLNSAFGFMEDKITLDQVEASMEGIVEKYQSEFYPFEVVMSGGGWQFLSKKEFHKTVAQLNGEKFLKRLSGAALETLSIIAYKQPITKGEIESIRGVNSDYTVQKLLEKDLVIISGRNENLPGHPLVYATSKNFMDYFGINSADDLPKIQEVLSEKIEPTTMNFDIQDYKPEIINEEAEEIDMALVVTEEGELIINEEDEIDIEEEQITEDQMTDDTNEDINPESNEDESNDEETED